MSQMIWNPVISLCNTIPFFVPSTSHFHSPLDQNFFVFVSNILRFNWFRRILTFCLKAVHSSGKRTRMLRFGLLENKKIHRHIGKRRLCRIISGNRRKLPHQSRVFTASISRYRLRFVSSHQQTSRQVQERDSPFVKMRRLRRGEITKRGWMDRHENVQNKRWFPHRLITASLSLFSNASPSYSSN